MLIARRIHVPDRVFEDPSVNSLVAQCVLQAGNTVLPHMLAKFCFLDFQAIDDADLPDKLASSTLRKLDNATHISWLTPDLPGFLAIQYELGPRTLHNQCRIMPLLTWGLADFGLCATFLRVFQPCLGQS